MFEDTDVTGHQGRCDEPDGLPQREVPRHHRKYHAEGLISHVGLARAHGVGIGGLVGEHRGTVLGVVPKCAGALEGFGLRSGQGLAHLLSHHGRDRVGLGLEQIRGGAQPSGALLEGRLAVVGETSRRSIEGRVDLILGERVEFANGRAGGRIDGGDGHVHAPSVVVGWCAPLLPRVPLAASDGSDAGQASAPVAAPINGANASATIRYATSSSGCTAGKK